MTPNKFEQALAGLGWKKVDFCRAAGLNKSTVSRWIAEDTAIPPWVDKFLGMALEVKRLHDTYVLPPKAGKKSDA